MRWAIIGSGGEVTRGEGTPPGLTAQLRAGALACFQAPGLIPLYVAGPVDLRWTVDHIPGQGERARWWGLQPPEGARLWLWPDGSCLALARTVEEAEAAIARFKGLPLFGKLSG